MERILKSLKILLMVKYCFEDFLDCMGPGNEMMGENSRNVAGKEAS